MTPLSTYDSVSPVSKSTARKAQEMSDTLKIITDNVPRITIDAWDLTAKEREEFDYLDWDAIEKGNDSRTFFRYRGVTYDLGEFEFVNKGEYDSGIRGWDGIQTDSYFSGIVIRYVGVPQDEEIVVGRYIA